LLVVGLVVHLSSSPFGFSSGLSCLTCVYYRHAKQRSTPLSENISKFFPKDAFHQRKRRGKLLREFLAGYRFLVDPVAI
jgi:hypothetical protein